MGGLFLLGLGRAADTCLAGEDHIGREQEQQNAAGNAKGWERDAEGAQQRLAPKREGEQDEAGDERAAPGHAPAESLGRAARQRRRDRGGADGIDDHEQGDEAVKDLSGHGGSPPRALSAMPQVLSWEIGTCPSMHMPAMGNRRERQLGQAGHLLVQCRELTPIRRVARPPTRSHIAVAIDEKL